jgi:exonuclease SbcC
MRPVLLEMKGFGSFREPTIVDFREAEYFALVGPTGSGKSTVIDALTFALYGSVPRWDNARTVALALAPTVARGTVRFVFDVATTDGRATGSRWERYVAARELRRAASGGVSVRTARLERLRDPSGTGAAEEEIDPVADGAAAVTKAVEELLGLPFGDFTTCVVLPQGEFAEFLHTEPRKRQETLVRLLGLGIYDVIAKEANTEARNQEQRAQVLVEQLGGYGDATVESEHATAERVTELSKVRATVDAAVPRLAVVAAEMADAEENLRRLSSERARLVGLAAPAGLDALAVRRRSADAELTTARASVDATDLADTAARDAIATAPSRAVLELARRHHAEQAGIAAELPGALERHAKAREADETACSDAAAAREAVDAARAVREATAAELAEAREAGSRLAAERDAVRAVVAPAGLDALDSRRSAAAAALEKATGALAVAERADAAARAASAAAPERAPLEQARRDHRELDLALTAHNSALAAAEAAFTALAAASERVTQAVAQLEHARTHRAASARADLAAALRPELIVGADCPVCAQVVAHLPEPLPAGDLAAAEHALEVADAAHDDARGAQAAAATAHARACAEAEASAARVARLTAALAAVVLPEMSSAGSGVLRGNAIGGSGSAGPAADATIPSAAMIEAALAYLDDLARDLREADDVLRRTRVARDAAAAETEAARAQAVAAASALRAARDPLVALGAPAVADDDPVAGWSALVAWAAAEATAREADLPAARASYATARSADASAEQAWRAAEQVAEQRRREETAAARAEQEAAGAVAHLERRERELAEALRGSPDDDEAAAGLERLAALEQAAKVADAALRSARARARTAEAAAAALEREVACAWDELRTARDPLVALDAPAIAGDDLAAAWAELVAWAGAAAGVRAAGERTAQQAAAAAAERRAEIARGIVDDLTAHDIPLERPAALRSTSTPTASTAADQTAADVVAADPGAAATAAATALERARGAHARIVERRAAAAGLLAERDAAVEAQQVAKMLGLLLRSDGFPRWLVASALDALVADASVSLAELSGGQFELTHENGEFLVVDHTDADARRPVKTLSGGETFQASLALALALSAQMSGLAARGAARLESIFLDEGFGTLDEANLETVASTLETLATRGDRVVGVITHVPGLAERVPVRFAVRRDQRSSSVTREGT